MAERGRCVRQRGKELVPPGIPNRQGAEQCACRRRDTHEGGMSSSRLRGAPTIPPEAGRGARARSPPQRRRSLDRLRSWKQRQSAKDDAGVWARPNGNKLPVGALKASTTTSMTPDDVHAMGQEDWDPDAEMDTIMKGLGFTTVAGGAAHAGTGQEDHHYQFSEGDRGAPRSRPLSRAPDVENARAAAARVPHARSSANMEVKRLPPESADRLRRRPIDGVRPLLESISELNRSPHKLGLAL